MRFPSNTSGVAALPAPDAGARCDAALRSGQSVSDLATRSTPRCVEVTSYRGKQHYITLRAAHRYTL